MFGWFVSISKKAFNLAKSSGLTDDLVQLTLKWVREASKKTVENAEKREWVVEILKAKGLPESVVRIAVELAYQAYRSELKKKLDK